MVAEWLERSNRNVESTGSDVAQGYYCIGNLSKS